MRHSISRCDIYRCDTAQIWALCCFFFKSVTPMYMYIYVYISTSEIVCTSRCKIICNVFMSNRFGSPRDAMPPRSGHCAVYLYKYSHIVYRYVFMHKMWACIYIHTWDIGPREMQCRLELGTALCTYIHINTLCIVCIHAQRVGMCIHTYVL